MCHSTSQQGTQAPRPARAFQPHGYSQSGSSVAGQRYEQAVFIFGRNPTPSASTSVWIWLCIAQPDPHRTSGHRVVGSHPGRIESQGRVSPAMVARSAIGPANVLVHICRKGRTHLGLPEQSSRTVTLTATLQMVCVRPRSALNWASSCSVGIPRRSAQVVRLVRVVRNCSSSAEGCR